jgi:hypothetical protein
MIKNRVSVHVEKYGNDFYLVYRDGKNVVKYLHDTKQIDVNGVSHPCKKMWNIEQFKVFCEMTKLF